MYNYYNLSTFLSLVILSFILFLFQCTNAIFYLFQLMTDNYLTFIHLSVIIKKRFKIMKMPHNAVGASFLFSLIT